MNLPAILEQWIFADGSSPLQRVVGNWETSQTNAFSRQIAHKTFAVEHPLDQVRNKMYALHCNHLRYILASSSYVNNNNLSDFRNLDIYLDQYTRLDKEKE